ncbi:MAG: NUDIX domain-containing protein [Bacteroidales bacterium]|nr:NUDIX domain-containing protein [Bacteroidales bacterium]
MENTPDMIQKHCPECGTALIWQPLEDEGLVPYCPQCRQYRFPMYNVAVSMIVIDGQTGKILLIKQYGRPNFILVAGYVNRGEAVEHAVGREIKEETGLTVSRIRFNRTSFFEPSNTLMCNFTAWVADADAMSPNKEIDSYQWFTPVEARRNIRPNSLAQCFLNAYLDETD